MSSHAPEYASEDFPFPLPDRPLFGRKFGFEAALLLAAITVENPKNNNKGRDDAHGDPD
jgi:hypothetical protein